MAAGIVLLALGMAPLQGGPSPLAEQLPGGPSPWWHLVPLLVGGAAMLGKSRRPLAAFLFGSAVLTVDVTLGGSLAVLLVWMDLLYTVGLRSPARTRQAVTVVVVVGAGALAVADGLRAGEVRQVLLSGLTAVGFVVVPLWWAAGVRHGHELAAAADDRARLEAERADALARAAELDRADAVREERAAMARDLHDVISSHLSAIAIHSAATLSAPPDPGRDRAALTQARTTSVAALEEMRTMIDLLRSDTRVDAWSTGGGLGSLPAVAGWARDHGLEVELDTHTGDVDLPASVEQSALRIVQEALTNALKHGDGPASVTVALADDALHLEVVNPCAAGTTAPGARDDGSRAGAGLTSMRERAEALGGRFDAGADDGRWVVSAALPTSVAGRA